MAEQTYREYLYSPKAVPVVAAVAAKTRTKVSAPEINKVSKSNEKIRQETLLGSDSVAPITFGRDRFFAKPFIAYTKLGFLYISYMVNYAGMSTGIGAYNGIYIDGVEVNSAEGFLTKFAAQGAQINKYYGTQAQTTDPLLSFAIPSFASAYKGFAYIVLKIPTGGTNGFPRIEVDINGIKIPRYESHTAFQKTDALVGSRNLVKNSCDLSQATWVLTSGTMSAIAVNIGNFKQTNIISGGANTNGVTTTEASYTGIAKYAVTVYYKAGTSNRLRVNCKNNTAVLSSTVSGVVGALAVSSSAAGTIEILSDDAFTEYRILKLIFTPTTPANVFEFLFGADSATSGQYAILYGVQVENMDEIATAVPRFSGNPVDIDCFIISKFAKWSINATSARNAANWNNDTLPNSVNARRSFGFTYAEPTKISDMIENIRAYTGCYFAWDNNELNFIQHKAKSSSHTFTADNIETIKLGRKKSNNIPTKVIVSYTDILNEFKKAEAVANKTNLYIDPTIPIRISRVDFIGCNNFEVAKREAIERLNQNLSDLTATLETFDEGLKVQVGDVVTVTHPIGLSNKLMLCVDLTEKNSGLWSLELIEYDPLLFSDQVESEPTYPDTNLPIHVPPDVVTGIVLTEEVYKRRNDQWDNRIKVVWDISTSAYVRAYAVRFKVGGVVVGSIQEVGTQTAFGPVQEDVQYTVEVSALTALFEGAVGSATIIPLGKVIIPPDVTNFSGFEIAGEVRLSWDAAQDLDIIGYEIRYVAVAGTWASSILIDRISSLRLNTKDIPVGTWDFLVRAMDSVGNYSNAEARITIVVTLDDSTLVVGSGFYIDSAANDLLCFRTKEIRNYPDIIYTNTSGQTWATLFGGAVLSTKTNPLASYQSAAGSFKWRSATKDIGYDVSGDFRITFDWKNYSGSVLAYVDLKDAIAGAYTEYSVASIKTKARYTYVEYRGTGLVRLDTGKQAYRIDAVTRSESGQSISLSSGGKNIVLANVYSAYKNITVTPINLATGHYAVVDAIVIGVTCSFNVYIFRSSDNTQQAVSFLWGFEGV